MLAAILSSQHAITFPGELVAVLLRRRGLRFYRRSGFRRRGLGYRCRRGRWRQFHRDLIAAIGIQLVVPVQPRASVPRDRHTRTFRFQGCAGKVCLAADDGFAEHPVGRGHVAIMVISSTDIELGHGVIGRVCIVFLEVCFRGLPVARFRFVEAFGAYSFKNGTTCRQ